MIPTRTRVTFVKVKVGGYGLVSVAKHHPPDFIQFAPWSRIYSFISHLNSPGSIQPGCPFRRTEPFKYTSLHCPTSGLCRPLLVLNGAPGPLEFRTWVCAVAPLVSVITFSKTVESSPPLGLGFDHWKRGVIICVEGSWIAA